MQQIPPSPADGSAPQNASQAAPLPLWKVWLPPLLVLFAVAGLALASYAGNERAEHEAFVQQTDRIRQDVSTALNDLEALLRGGQSLLQAAPGMTPQQWRTYAGGLPPAGNTTDVMRLAYSPAVPANRLAEHLRLRQAETPGYEVYPPGSREVYFPLQYMVPMTPGFTRAQGFDMFSEPVRRAAIERARDTGHPTLSGSVLLAQATGERAGPSCLLLLPVYRPGAPTGTVEQRRSALLGILSAPFNTKALFANILAQHGNPPGISVYEGRKADAQTLLCSLPLTAAPAETRSVVAELFGSAWTLTFDRPQQSPFAPSRREPLMLLTLGVVLAAFIHRIVRGIDATRARAEALAAAMTAELRQSEAYNRAVFQNSSLGIGVCGADGRLRDANPALLEFLGYEREEFSALHWQDVVHPDYQAEYDRLMAQVLKDGRSSFQLELRVQGKTRGPCWAVLNIGLVRDEDGSPRYWIGALKDISEHKAAAEAQAERRAYYQAMFEDNRAVCLLVNPATGNIVDTNHAATHFYGYSRQEMQSMSVTDINPLPAGQMAEAMAQAAEEGGLFDFVHRLKDGSLRNVQVHSGPFRANGRTLLLSTVQDVTDRVSAEAALSESRKRFQNLVESTDQGVVILDQDDRTTYVNPAFAHMLAQPKEALLGQHVTAHLDPEEHAQREKLAAARRRGSREAYETRIRRSDGATLLVHVMPFPLYDAQGGFLGSCGLVADITAQHAAREAERQRQVRRAALLRLHEMQQAPRKELLDYALGQMLTMTGSAVGYLLAYDDETQEFTPSAWSALAMEQCRVEEPQSLYRLEQTGVWGDPVRLREPVLQNDFAAAGPVKSGFPDGHVALSRFLSIPVIRAGRVRAVVGMANKEAPYTEEDIAQLTLFADGLWSVLERQDSDNKLRQMTERFQRAVRAGRIGLWEWDLATGLVNCDPGMEQLFGLEKGSLTGTPEDWLCRVHPEDRDAVRQALATAAKQGGRFEASFRVLGEADETTHVEASAAAQLGPRGEPLRLVGVHIDVTRLREAEQELARSHRFLQTLIDALPHTFFCKDLEGRYLLVNRAFGEMHNQQPTDSVLRKRVEEVMPSEAAALHSAWDLRALEAGPGATVSYEYTHELPAGGQESRMVYKGLVRFPDGLMGIVGFNVDNSLRKRAEDQLAQSEERFRHLFEQAPTAYQSLDEEGNLLLANAAWLDMLGYTSQEAIGRNFSEFLAQKSIDLFREQFPRFKQRGTVDGVEYLLRKKDGGRILVSVNGRVSRDGKQNFLCTHCTLTDITERRAAEERLAQNHRFLQTLIDTLPVPFICKDEKGRYLLVNERFLMLHRVSGEQVLGRSMREFMPQELALQHEQHDTALLARPETLSTQYEAQFDQGDGSPFWLVFKSRLTLPDGGQGIAAFGLNITERKLAEEALRKERRRLADVILGTNTGTWEWDIATGAVVGNERWAEIVGHTLEDLGPLDFSKCMEMTHPDDRRRLEKALTLHLAEETPLFDCEYRLRHKEGHWVWVHARGRVFLRGPQGEPLLMSGAYSDIQDRKLAEDQLALVARFPVENPHPVLRADDEGVLLFANPSAEPLLTSWGQKVGGRLPRELRRELRLALESSQARTSERSYADGVYSITVSPFVDKGYANIYAVNETQRKSAETALRLSELRYRELAVMLRLMCDNVPDMIWAKDVDNRYIFANKAMCEQFLGLDDTTRPLGKTEEYFARREQATHPDDPNWHTVWTACVRSDHETLQGVGRGQYVEAGYFKGQFKHYDVRKAPFVNDQGAVIGTVGSARDITERKAAEEALAKSEERFRTLAQVSPVGIFQADANGRCTFVNEQWSRISGYPKTAALGLGWVRTLEPDARRAALRGFRETARTGKDFATEFRFRSASGQNNWVLVRAAAERDSKDNYSGMVGALTDITELKRAEAALRKAMAEAEAATHAKAVFLANMSHEIRTPLAGVIGTTRLLAQSQLDEAQQRLAEMAVYSGQALLDVVNDILDFSKIEAGQLSLRKAPFALRQVLGSVAGPCALLAQERGLNLVQQVAPNVPDALVGDESRLGQVLRNLLNNALKFTEHGVITLAVQLESRTENQARLLFSVSDTGIGIDPGYLPSIFNSFSQGDSSYGKQHGGTGLGLAICKSLLEQMGGGIQVFSTLGKGSTFTADAVFALASQADKAPLTAQPAAKPLPAQVSAAQALSPPPARVLLADDNAIGRVLMEHVLKAAGHEVVSVGDGNAVLRALRESSFDLVLMDVQMPLMDGLAATRHIRQGQAGERSKGIAIVALTAYVSSEDRQNFLDAGMDDSVAKPAEEAPLFAAMKHAMGVAQDRAKQNPPRPGTERDTTASACPAAEAAPRLSQDYLARTFGDNPALLELLLRQFQDISSPDLVRQLEQCLAEGDLTKGLAVAHRARGTLGVIGAEHGTLLAAGAEAAAASGESARFRELATALLAELGALAEHLRQDPPKAKQEHTP